MTIKLKYFLLFLILTQLLISQNDSLKNKSLNTDDFFTPRKKKFVFLVSNRFSEDSKFDVYKTIPHSDSINAVIVKGKFEALDNPKFKKIKISLFNASNNQLVGTYNSNQYTGAYLLCVIPNVRYLMKIELAEYGMFREILEVPLKTDYDICKQHITVQKIDKKGVINVNNYFTDEDEKVAYIKSINDTTEILTSNKEFLEYTPAGKTVPVKLKSNSKIDEIVKQQLEEERKKPVVALASFMAKKYEIASQQFSDLLKKDPFEPFYNYYFGVCQFKLNKNKLKTIQSLQIASTVKDINNDVHYYLGKSYMNSYLFNDAINSFNTFKLKAKPDELIKYEIDLLINNCTSGNELMASPLNINVIKRQQCNETDLLANCATEIIGSRLRYKTDIFSNATDKLKKKKLVLTNFNQRYFIYVAHSNKPKLNLDLYKNLILPNGKLSIASELSSDINTPYEENYPYISHNGLTLYFSSRGHNSMGGLDIFKCTRPDTTSDWSKPINLGYPINSPFDDYMFITDSTERNAFYFSNRKENVTEQLFIKLPSNENDYYVIKGNFNAITDSSIVKDALITLFNNSTGELAGVYKTNSQTGHYLFILSPGTKYDVSIESEGYHEITSSFDVPQKRGDYVLKQILRCVKEKNKKALKITNYFTQYESDKVDLDNLPKPTIKENNFPSVATKKISRNAQDAEKDKTDLELAEKMFDQNNYQETALILSKLSPILNFTPLQHYKYGVSLYNTKRDKTDCIKELEIATKSKEVPTNVFYYLAKGYQENYQFTNAIQLFKKYQTIDANDSQLKQIDKEIEICNNSIELINKPKLVLEVYDKKRVDLNTIQNSITQLESGGKILMSTDDIRTPIDKKKNYKPLFYLTPDKTCIYVSSFGDNENGSKDIYQLKKLGNGKWSSPYKIDEINSDLDEEFPCLSKDGKYLYFSSKGYKGMGGYDIYRSEWDAENNKWKKPINLGAPVNSPYDDLYFLE